MSSLSPIPYRSGPPAARPSAPSEFDHAYEQERGRWLRRRFLYYSGISAGFGLLLAVPTFIGILTKESLANAWWQIAVLCISNGVYIAALIIAWRTRPIYARILRIALATYLFASLLSIGFVHLYYVASATEIENGMVQGFWAGMTGEKPPSIAEAATKPLQLPTSLPVRTKKDASTRPFVEGPIHYSYVDPIASRIGSVKPRFTLPWALDNLVYFTIWFSLLFSFTFNHLFISSFLPWTVRESLRPALCIGAAFIFAVLVDTVVGVAWWPFALVAIVLTPFAFAPGPVVCWWRYSRFNKQFRQRFESAGYKKLQDELVGARRIHESNLPQPINDGPIRVAFDYEPMREIGGDLLMLHRSNDEDAVTAVLFDVTGHGVSAALSVNRIVGEIERTFAEDADASPERVICNLNKYIAATLAKHHIYATAIVARVDATANTLEYVNAGHPPAVIVRAGGVDVRELQPTAMMLGIVADADFDCAMTSVPFAAGDALVCYTDGASEALDPVDQMLGIPGVFRTVAMIASGHGDPASWPAAIHDRILAHRQSPPTDDTLILAMWRA